MTMQPIQTDVTHSEAENLLLESAQHATSRSGAIRSRAAAGLLAVAGCLAVAAIHSGSQHSRTPSSVADSAKGLTQLAESTRMLPDDKFKQKCNEVKSHVEKAKKGHQGSSAFLKRHNLDIDDIQNVESFDGDPCEINTAASVKMKKLLKNMEDIMQSNQSEAIKNAKHKSSTTTTRKRHSTTTLLKVEKEEDKCSSQGEDCRSTKCCFDPGMQCYSKSADWAQCKESCIPGKDPSDVDSTPWNCSEIGDRTPGEARPCSEVGDNCMESKCCTTVGHACYSKNKTYATCKASCSSGPDYSDDDDWKSWECKQLGNPKPGKGPWVDDECADDGSDCRSASCCKTPSFQCYEMGPGWAQCREWCSTESENSWEDPWTCAEIGRRTPPDAWEAQMRPRGDKVARWVKDRCSHEEDDCSHTQCCLEPGMQCYSKDKHYARCMDQCDGDNETKGWQCKELGSRSFGVARKQWPSLFCFAVFRVCHPKDDCYEQALLERIYELGPDSAGIFGCDDWGLASNEVATIGGRKSWEIGNIKVGISKDKTAANTKLFMKVWDLVIEDGRYRYHDWSVKVDPDAVLCPWKLTQHLGPHTNDGDHGGRLYVVNCNAWPDSESFPMMYGSVEILSRGAVMAYAENKDYCARILPWEDWGEDFYITRCMDQIDVGRLEMFNVVGDNVCVGPGQGGTGDCSEGDRAAFHPFKDIESWTKCYNNAVGYHPPTPAPEEPQEVGSQDWQRLKKL